MKAVILALCFCLAVAESSDLMDDLEKLLSSESKSDSNAPDLSILEELDSLSQDAQRTELTAEHNPEGPKFGYCLDGSSLAEGVNMKGCARKLCYDEAPADCNKKMGKLNKMERKKVCYKDYFHYRARCPYSCGFCKPRSPGLECRRRFGKSAKYGCCWNGVPALTPDKRDCMVCTDITPHTCRQFYNNMFGEKCGTNSYRIRSFLYTRCPRLCGRCA